MEAKEFLKQLNRICKEHNDCYDCPLNHTGCNGSMIDNPDDNGDDFIKAVETWAKEHPVKTNFDVLKQAFPEMVKYCSLDDAIKDDRFLGYVFTKDVLKQEYKEKERFEYSHE